MLPNIETKELWNARSVSVFVSFDELAKRASIAFSIRGA
jgi:hypothetical protein